MPLAVFHPAEDARRYFSLLERMDSRLSLLLALIPTATALSESLLRERANVQMPSSRGAPHELDIT